jgi:hypothetical protein
MTTRRTTKSKKKPRKRPHEHRCHDCGAREGELHQRGCDMERCPFCHGQLIGCDCAYEKLGYTHDYKLPFNGLPPEVYTKGLPDAEYDGFMKMCDERGRIPYIVLPFLCARCGKLWPEMFGAEDDEWLFYMADNEGAVLCRKCYDTIKRLIDKRSGLTKYPPRVTEVINTRYCEHERSLATLRAQLQEDDRKLVELGLKTREQIDEEASHG